MWLCVTWFACHRFRQKSARGFLVFFTIIPFLPFSLLTTTPSSSSLPLLLLLPFAMRLPSALLALPLLAQLVTASPWREDLVDYNLNVNKDAKSVLEYDSERPNATYNPSPPNWRALPTYTILLDKFADGDPTNNDFFGTPFESDYRETQLRYGGDLKGLGNRLDYLQGMGIKVIFMSGTPFLNMIWQADSKSSFCLLQFQPLIHVNKVIRQSTSVSLIPIGGISRIGAI